MIALITAIDAGGVTVNGSRCSEGMSREKMPSAVRKSREASAIKQLREALGLNQVDFGRAVGRSYASVKGYEAGRPAPPDVLEKMRAMALERGRDDIARELEPPGAGDYAGPGVRVRQSTLVPSRANRAHWHQLLDEVLDSENSEAVRAVQSSLTAFSKYLRAVPRFHSRGKQIS